MRTVRMNVRSNPTYVNTLLYTIALRIQVTSSHIFALPQTSMAPTRKRTGESRHTEDIITYVSLLNSNLSPLSRNNLRR